MRNILFRNILSFFIFKNISSSNMRSYSVYHVGSIFGFLGHGTFIFVFRLFGFNQLTLLNHLSVFVYLLAFLLNRKGKHTFVYLMCSVEIIIHAFFSMYYLGWESGFQYYILLTIPLAFFSPIKKYYIKFIISFLIGCIYLGFFYFTSEYTLVKDQAIISLFHYMNALLAISALSLVSYYYSRTSQRIEMLLLKSNNQLEILSRTDSLTGLLNRRFMIELIEREVAEIEINKKPSFSIIIADIDDFKKVNDRYGHNYGDYVLTEITQTIHGAMRKNDYVARWGGEEFLVLLPQTSLEEAADIAERIRKTIMQQVFSNENERINITCTFGVSQYFENLNIAKCIQNADKALYQGKESGRNCVRQ